MQDDTDANQPEADSDEAETPSAAAATTTTPEGGPETTPEGSSDEEASEGLDPQLIALCVVLWIVAVGIAVYSYGDLRTDWLLGNINEAIEAPQPTVDQESCQRLIELGISNDAVAQRIRAEFEPANAITRSPRYRVVLTKAVLQEIPTPLAVEALALAAQDADSRVRANAYVALQVQAERTEQFKERVLEVLTRQAQEDPEPISQSYAVECRHTLKPMGNFDDPQERGQVCWAWTRMLGQGLRQPLPGSPPEQQAGLVTSRERIEVVLRIFGRDTDLADEEKLPFTADGDLATRDAEIKQIEDWIEAELGYKIPEGERLQALLDRIEAADGEDTAEEDS